MNKWIFRLVTLIVSVASPELRKLIGDMLNNLEQQAKKTSNPWDDMLVGLLKTLMLGGNEPDG